MTVQTKTIREVTEKLIDYRGKTPPKTKSGIRLVTAKIVKEGRIVEENNEYIAPDLYESWMRRGLPLKGDILITTEAPLGEVAQIKTDEKIALAQRIILLRGRKELINQNYYFHALRSGFVQAELFKRSQGVTVTGIKQSELLKVEIPLFNIQSQQKIASILSAYDDLTEKNNKRIKILEQIAKSIYREWFMNKKNRNWKEVEVKEFADVYRGKSYKGSELSEKDGVPFITIKCINRGGGFRFDGLKLFNGKAKESNTVKPGDIVIAVTDMTQERMIVARPARIPKLKESGTFVFSMDLVKVLAKDEIYQNFLYGFFMYSGFGDLVKNYANGVNVLHLSQEHVANAKLLLPDKDNVEKYDQIVNPLYKEMDNLQLKNEILFKAKNLLLPKLISGELDVENLDIKIRPEIL